MPEARKDSRTRRRKQDLGEDYQEYTGHVTDDDAFQSQQQILSGFQPPQQNQLGLTESRDPRQRKHDQSFGTGLAENIDYNDYENEEQDFDVDDQNYVVDQDGLRLNSVLQKAAGLTGGHQSGGNINPNQNLNINGQDDQQ